MTSRRSMSGWEERQSRALQFRPGHVGGRIPSAQPIRRRGGTLRRASVGAAAAPVVAPPLDDIVFVIANGTDGNFDLAAYITPTAGDVLLALFASRGTTVTMPTGWTSLASGASGALDYEVAYRVWTGTDTTTGSVSPFYDAPPPAWTSYAGYFDCMLLHFKPTTGAPVPTVSELTTVTASASEAMPTGTATFNVVGGIRSTDNINTPSVAEPTYSWTLEDVAFWVVGMESDYMTPAVESGTVTAGGGAVNCDWVKFLVTWA